MRHRLLPLGLDTGPASQEGIMPPLVGRLETPITSRRWTAPLVVTVVLMAIVATGCAGGLGGSTAQIACPAGH
jgi:hypothetical protein